MAKDFFTQPVRLWHLLLALVYLTLLNTGSDVAWFVLVVAACGAVLYYIGSNIPRDRREDK